MRTIPEIKQTLTDRFITEPAIITAYGLTPGQSFEDQFSRVSLGSILFDISAFASWTIENILSIIIADRKATGRFSNRK